MVFILFLLGRLFQLLQLLFVLKLPWSVHFGYGWVVLQPELLAVELSCCVPRGVPYFLVMMSFDVVVPVGSSLGVQWSDLPM